MNTIGFQNQEKLAIYQLVATILHLGNVKFDTTKIHYGSDGVAITNSPGNELVLCTLQFIFPPLACFLSLLHSRFSRSIRSNTLIASVLNFRIKL